MRVVRKIRAICRSCFQQLFNKIRNIANKYVSEQLLRNFTEYNKYPIKIDSTRKIRKKNYRGTKRKVFVKFKSCVTFA